MADESRIPKPAPPRPGAARQSPPPRPSAQSAPPRPTAPPRAAASPVEKRSVSPPAKRGRRHWIGIAGGAAGALLILLAVLAVVSSQSSVDRDAPRASVVARAGRADPLPMPTGEQSRTLDDETAEPKGTTGTASDRGSSLDDMQATSASEANPPGAPATNSSAASNADNAQPPGDREDTGPPRGFSRGFCGTRRRYVNWPATACGIKSRWNQ